jgi:aminoglycoside phosphotransferase (APT) family kinase protein
MQLRRGARPTSVVRMQTISEPDLETVRRLIAAQFPQWAHLPVRPVDVGGWDNRTFHLGDTMSVRLPSAAPYALAVAKEHRWLPVLAPRLPLPIPVPLAQGAPGEGYPHPWSVRRWIDGVPALGATVTDLTAFAGQVAAFLVALRAVDPTGGPGPGLHNWYRGGPLAHYDADTRRAVADLGAEIPAARVTALWEEALDATDDGPPVWFHGDVAAGNLLLRGGALGAVIDFGTCGVGDPACDLVLAWTMFAGESRQAFRDTLGVDAGQWARGRGWALWKALITYRGDPASRRVLRAILAEDDERPGRGSGRGGR